MTVPTAAAVKATLKIAPKVHALINSAGITGPNTKVWDYPVDAWRQVMDVNLTGLFLCCREWVPHLREAGEGRIVNIASDAGRVGSSQEAVYSACKGGIIAFTKTVAREVARKGITLNAVCPGPTDTPLLAAAAGEGERAERMRAALVNAIPMKRVGQPEDIAATASWLCAEESGFVSGQVIYVAGGPRD